MTTEDALLALSEDQENVKALLELGMNERQAIEKAARRWFVDRNEAHLAFYSILPLLALNATSYDPRITTPTRGLKSMPRDRPGTCTFIRRQQVPS